MSAIKGRRKRVRDVSADSTMRSTVNCLVDVRLKAVVDQTAAATGMSKAWVLERILERVPVNDDAVALWANDYVEPQLLTA